MNGFIRYMIGTALSSFIVCQSINADAVKEKIADAIETGITSNTFRTHDGSVRAKEAAIVTTYDYGTATVDYNSAGGSTGSDGWIDVQDYNDGIIYHVDLDTLGSTGIDITFEALVSDNTSTAILLYTKSFSAVDTGYSLPISEKGLKYVRVGGQATGTDGTDSCTIKIRAEGKRK